MKKIKVAKNTIYKQKSNLDQFYTNKIIAKECFLKLLEIYEKNKFDIFLEPSAGNGSFLKLLPKNKRTGLDLDPKDKEIIKQDFFDYQPPPNKKIITIGNPPFGRICSVAIKFFNHAAKFSEVIAFIIPKTFQKQSLQNKLDLNFHLKLNMDLPKNSFMFDGVEYDVPCCFQVWEKLGKKRVVKKVDLINKVFDFVKKSKADIAIRRVGGRAGRASINIRNLSKSSHYFLRLKSKNISKKEFVDIINNIDFSSIVNATVGVRSLSMPEFILGIRASKKIEGV